MSRLDSPKSRDAYFRALYPHAEAFIEHWVKPGAQPRFREILEATGRRRALLRELVWVQAFNHVGEPIPWKADAVTLARRLRSAGAPDTCVLLTHKIPEANSVLPLEDGLRFLLTPGHLTDCFVLFCKPGDLILQSVGAWNGGPIAGRILSKVKLPL